MQSDRVAQQILLEEARIWVALRHPNIVTVIDIGQHESDWFLVLELVDGAAADQVLHACGPIPVDEALCIVERVAKALSYAHRLQTLGKQIEVIHRDVKPANILISLDGKVKLTDYGIARTNDRLGQTKAGIVRGSLHYMAPEQVKRQTLDNRTDLFALGCTLHALLTGRPLISGPKEAVIRILQQGNIPDPPEEIPEEVRALLRDLTAADPDRRLPSADDVVEAARELLAPRTPEDVERDLARRVLDVRERFDAGTGEVDQPIGLVGTRTVLSEEDRTLGRDHTRTQTRSGERTSDVDLTLDVDKTKKD